MGVSRGREPGKSIPNKLVLGERIIHSKPPFTINQIKKAIPLHCFQRSLLRSFSYAIFDLIFASALYYIANTYFPLLQHPYQYFAWPIYWLSQGSIFTAISTIGHECGHRGFSDYQLVDDIVGFIFHTFLLVPYFSFKFTHRRHHSNTASLERDELCLPKPKHELRWYFKYLTNPPARLLIILATITLGWPLYLTFNISGRFHDSFASHYVPNSPLFHEKERLQVHISNVGILGMCYLLYKMAIAKGMIWVIRIYGVPILVMNGFLVLITSLQHTHPSFPYYDSSEWEWLRGNLVTVDRDYGMVLNKVFHNLTNTHVVHHLFPSLPHYHAIEATKAVMPVLGEYYQFDDTPILKALWREFRECVYVELDDKNDSSKGVFWFHNKL